MAPQSFCLESFQIMFLGLVEFVFWVEYNREETSQTFWDKS